MQRLREIRNRKIITKKITKMQKIMKSKVFSKIDSQVIKTEKIEIITKTKIVDISHRINTLEKEEREFKVSLPENIIINKNKTISKNLLWTRNLYFEKQEVKEIIIKKTISNLYPQKTSLIISQVKKGNLEAIAKITNNLKVRIKRSKLKKKTQTIVKKAKSQCKKISQDPIENIM